MTQVIHAHGMKRAVTARRAPLAAFGKWRLVQHLQDGQWARVYRARPQEQPGEDRADYVVKALRDALYDDPVAIAVMQREAYVGSTVSSPHLVPVLSASVQVPPIFLVLPYLEGRNLAMLLQSAGRLRTPKALWIARQIAEGLQPLHQQGWIHGDLNPSNIMVSSCGHATLIDLGLCRRVGSDECRGRRPVIGTIAYAAPEMMASSLPLSPVCDVYSLGVTLYQMLTGHLPFASEDPAELAEAHLRQRPPDARKLQPQVSRHLAALLGRMLAKEPLRRPTCDELIPVLVALEIETLKEHLEVASSCKD